MELLMLIIFIALMMPAIYWRAYVGVILWGWFVTPAFGILPPSAAFLGGIVILVELLVPWRKSKHSNSWEDFGKGLVYAFVVPLMTLLVGWLWKTWLL